MSNLQTLEAKHSLDVASIARLTAGLKAEAAAVSKITIDTEEDEQEAGARLVEVKRLGKDLADLIAQAKRPFLDVTQAVDKLTKPGRDDIAALTKALTDVIGKYRVQLATQRSKALEAARDAAVERDTKAITTALNEAQDATPQKLDNLGVKLVWKVKRIAEDLVPRDWCIPDEKRITAHAKQYRGTPDDPPAPIPGVIFELEAETRVSR